MSAETSTCQTDRPAKEGKRDPAHVQNSKNGSRQPSDNVSQWLALEAKREEVTTVGAELGNIPND